MMDALPVLPDSGAPGADLLEWARSLELQSAEAILAAASRRFGDRLAVVTSFQDTGSVILDIAHRNHLPIRVITLDTGRLPEETHIQIDRVRERYGIEVEIVVPDSLQVEELVRERGPNLFRVSPEHRFACCNVRKVQPFRRAVADLDGWIAGLRREQGASRRAIRTVEVDRSNRPDGSLIKIHPLADWTSEQVWQYIDEHRVPYHPLYDRGYRSIGCAPCTRAARPGEPVRAARWWWEEGAKECGLHLVQVGSR